MIQIMKQEVEKQTGHFESFDGTSIYYEMRGQGKPIVFVYGIGCLMNHWHPQVTAFSQNYQTICLDFRGHQKSESPKDLDNLNIDSLARDTHALLNHLKISSASFWGHSFGGQVVLRAFDLFPEQFKNLVFVNAFVKDPIGGMFGVDFVPKIFQFVKDTHQNYPDLVTNVWRASVLNPLAAHLSALAGGFNLRLTSIKDIEVYARGIASLDLKVFMKLFEDMMAYDASSVLEKIRIPTLIISGEKDGVTPVAHQIELHSRIAGSELQNVPYGSHCTQLDLPEFVNLRAEKFYMTHKY